MPNSLHPDSLAPDPISRSTSPRVVHLVPAMFGADGVAGGAERYALELAHHMAEAVPTTLLSFGERERSETMGALRIRVLGEPWYVRGQRFNPLKWSIFAELRKADVIHCHQQHILASSLAAVFGRLSRRPVFVTELGGGGWDVSAYISTDRWFNGHLHVSAYSRSIVGHSGKPWAHVIMGGVDSARFSPGPAALRDGAVLFVGRLLPHKGVNYLIEALPGGMRLKLIGKVRDPRYCEGLRTLAAGRCVEFHHDFDDAALIDHYRRALCVVLPSVYRTIYGEETAVPELLGQTLLEGMACGLPAICTAVASLPEVVEDGVSGFVVPPNDSRALAERLCWLRDHPESAAAMGAAARRRVLERFTWPEVVRRCLAIYAGTDSSEFGPCIIPTMRARKELENAAR
jgi:glycosyltransferase involved in cell wall biosynthesis